jgi:thymidylate kinase
MPEPYDGHNGERLDVVAELAAHQQNLEPPPPGRRAALLALPPPPLCRLIAADWFEAMWRRGLARLAEELGGGDGPLPLVHAAGHGSDPLDDRLAALWQSGVRDLFVHGMADQPGHARALRHRWPGALHRADGAGLAAIVDALHTAVEPVRWLDRDVARVAPGTAAPGGARLVLAAVDKEGDPRAVREQGAHVWPFAPDQARRLGLWSGTLPPSGSRGTAAGERIRGRWDTWWSERGQPDVVRMAALGLDPALEAALRDPSPPAPRTGARVIAITGIDGAGKSSHAARLARLLGERGARVQVLKLYRQGAFLDLANELGARTRRGAPLAAFRTSRVVKLIDSLRVHRDQIAPALGDCDALVMDRHVETHIAAARSQLGWDLSQHPALAPFPPADVRFWLEVDPAIALERRDARGDRPSADEHPLGMRGYAIDFRRQARGEREVRLDGTAPAEENARAIAARALPLLAASGPPVSPALTAPSGAPVVRPPHSPRCALKLGPCPVEPELGADVLALRGALESWIGRAARGVPEAFWLEAYAAQLLLDVRTFAPAQARAALWPGALVRMADHADIEMLRELERMLLAEVDIAGYAAGPDGYVATFAALGAHPSAAERLAREYAAGLDRLARECAWPAASSR